METFSQNYKTTISYLIKNYIGLCLYKYKGLVLNKMEKNEWYKETWFLDNNNNKNEKRTKITHTKKKDDNE